MVNFAFGGCGWLMSYGLGVGKALQINCDKIARKWPKGLKYSGSSGGSLCAAVLACHMPTDPFQMFLVKAAEQFQQMSVFDLNKHVGPELFNGLNTMLPTDVVDRVNGRLYVSISKLDAWGRPRNRLISNFLSRDHLIRTLMVSCHIPGYTKSSFSLIRFEDSWCMDGGLTDDAPLLPFPEEPTYSVSPFKWPLIPYDINPHFRHPCNSSQICISQGPFPIGSSGLLPVAFRPKANVLEALYERGQTDGTAFLELLLNHDRHTCKECQSRRKWSPSNAEIDTHSVLPFRQQWLYNRVRRVLFA